MPGYIEICLYLALILLGIVVILLWLSERQWRKKRQTFAKIKDSFEAEQLSPLEKTERALCEPLRDRVPWRHSRMGAFYQKNVAPFEKILGSSGYLKPVSTLLAILDAHGDCPSVVRIQQDHEYQALQNVYDLLSRITLLDHSLNVAEQMIDDVARSKTRDPEMIMGKILVAALGHDIGKIPDLMEGENYRKGDHPYISYLVLKNVILPETSPQHEDILSAVKSHHFQVREGFTHDLRKADQAAREMEAEQLSLRGESASPLIQMLQERATLELSNPKEGKNLKEKGASPDTIDLSWLNLDEFLAFIEPEINRIENKTYFRAFSMNNGLVYIMLSLVSEAVIQLAKRHNHTEVLVNADTTEKKRSIEFTVKTLLGEKGLIPSFIGKGFAGARFGLMDANGKKKMVGIYMPVEARAFKTTLTDFENKKIKDCIISEIVEVQPLVGQKKPGVSL
jgi:hypothetical protein